MQNKIYNQFKRDILDLYCSTKHSGVESEFIKTAAIELTNLHRWLLSNKSIKKNLIHGTVYDALIILGSIRGSFSYGDKLDRGTIVKMLHESIETVKCVPTLVTFYYLLDDMMAKDLLQPYRDIIELLYPLYKDSQIKVSREEVFKDLSVLKKAFFESEVQEEESDCI